MYAKMNLCLPEKDNYEAIRHWVKLLNILKTLN